MTPANYIQVLVALFSILGAGLGSYIGLRSALVRIEEQVKGMEKRADRHSREFDAIHAKLNLALEREWSRSGRLDK